MQYDTLSDFRRTTLQRLKLAGEVILAEAEAEAIPDLLEVELTLFKEHAESALLLPAAPEPTSD